MINVYSVEWVGSFLTQLILPVHLFVMFNFVFNALTLQTVVIVNMDMFLLIMEPVF